MKIGNLELYGIIYKITNILNGKCYIGQTIQNDGFNARYKASGQGIERVYNSHKCNKNKDRNYNMHLLNSIEKYGFSNFNVNEIFDVAFSKEELNIKEKLWISFYKSIDSNYGYNSVEGGTDAKSITTKIICLNNKEIFDSITDSINQYHTKSMLSHLSNPKKYKSAGKDKITNEKLIWAYYEDYLNMSEKDIEERILFANTVRKSVEKRNRNPSTYAYRFRKIKCINTEEIFNSISEVTKKYNISTHIFKALKDINKSSGIHPITGEPLKWEYVI